MKKKIIVPSLIILTIIIIIISIILVIKNNTLEKNKIEIIDATYSCAQGREKFYEDNNYIYYFPCRQRNSVFVKFPNGNIFLVTKALEEEKVTIDELIKAGLNVYKEEK